MTDAEGSQLLRRVWVAICVADVVCLILQLAWTQPVLYVSTSGATALDVRASSDALSMRSVNTPGPVRMRIVHRGGAEPRSVSLTPPTGPSENPLSAPDLYRVERGDWHFEGGRWVSLVPGSSLLFQADVSEANVAFACGEYEGEVCVGPASSTTPRCIDLGACVPRESWERYTLESENRTWFREIDLFAGDVRVSPNEGRITRAWIGLGGRVLRDLPVNQDGSASEFSLSFVRVWAAARVLFDLLWFLLQVGLLLLVYTLIGLAFVAPAVGKLSLPSSLVMASVAGFGITVNIATAINHVLSLQWGIGIALGVALGVGVFHRRSLLTLLKERLARAPEREERGLLITMVLTTSVFFFPAAIENGWYAGQNYTDAFDYTAFSNLSLLGPIDRDVLAIRYADFVSLGISSSFLGGDTRTGFAPHLALFWALIPPITFAFFQRTKGSRAALVNAAIAGNFALAFAVASQCYMPHFMAIVLNAAGACAIAAWFEREDASHDLWWVVLTGAIFAGAVSVYPYQAFAPLGFGTACVWSAFRKKSWRPLLDLARVGLATVLICQFNLEAALGTGDNAAEYGDALNGIGRNLVFPFHENLRVFPPILFGLRDFINNSRIIPDLCTGVASAGACGPIVESTRLVNQVMVVAAIPYALVWLYGCWVLRKTAAGIAVNAILAVLALVSVMLFIKDQPYFFGKMMLTLASVGVLALVAGLSDGLTQKHKAVRVVAAVLCLFLVVGNLRSLVFDHLVFFMPRAAPEIRESRTHVQAQGTELRQLEYFASEVLGEDCDVVVVGELVEHHGTDRDRVVYNRAFHLLSDATLHYGPDESRPYYTGTDVSIDSPQIAARGDYLLVWRGRLGYAPPPTFQRIMRNDLFSMYARRRCSPSEAPCACSAEPTAER